MPIIEPYSLAVFFCAITVFCWGYWANTQKTSGSSWRFELFHWDYVIGIVILSLVSGYVLESIGDSGRGFAGGLFQGSSGSYSPSLAGRVIFILANIFIVPTIAFSGIAVAILAGK